MKKEKRLAEGSNLCARTSMNMAKETNLEITNDQREDYLQKSKHRGTAALPLDSPLLRLFLYLERRGSSSKVRRRGGSWFWRKNGGGAQGRRARVAKRAKEGAQGSRRPSL